MFSNIHHIAIIGTNYQKTREFYVEKLGFKVINPEGAFYIFVDYRMFSDMNSFDFAMDVLNKTQVGLVPGICFSVEGFVRLSISHNFEVLEEALDRIAAYLGKTRDA